MSESLCSVFLIPPDLHSTQADLGMNMSLKGATHDSTPSQAIESAMCPNVTLIAGLHSMGSSMHTHLDMMACHR
jgi:hypothetical protein